MRGLVLHVKDWIDFGDLERNHFLGVCDHLHREVRLSIVGAPTNRSRHSRRLIGVEEVRIKGELRYVRVTPRHGRPYYLIPDANGATFIRRDSLDSSLKVPMWVLFSW